MAVKESIFNLKATQAYVNNRRQQENGIERCTDTLTQPGNDVEAGANFAELPQKKCNMC